MRARYYALAALFVAAVPSIARAEHLLSFRFGRHSYTSNFEQQLLGGEYAYKFPSALSLSLGGDYISDDFGGDPGVRTLRGVGGPNVHFKFGCLPIDVVPGIGLEYLKFSTQKFGRDDAFGAYARMQVLVRVLSEISVGMYGRKSWNPADTLGQEVVGQVQFHFGVPRPQPAVPRPPVDDPGSYIHYTY